MAATKVSEYDRKLMEFSDEHTRPAKWACAYGAIPAHDVHISTEPALFLPTRSSR